MAEKGLPRATGAKLLVIGLNYAPEHAGIAPYTAGMAQGLASGFEVQVLTTYPHYPEWRFQEGSREWRSDDRDGDVSVSRLRHYLPTDPTGLSRMLSEASFAARAAVARHARADAIICVTPGLLPVATGRLLGRIWRVPVGVVVQDLYSRAFEELDLFGGRLNAAVHLFESRLLQSAQGVVAIHDRMAETVVRSYGVPETRVQSIPNWTHVTPPTGDRAATRRELGWADGEVVVLHAGNMGAKQGLEHVIEAGRDITRSGRPVRIVLMGDGSRRSDLERAARGVDAVEFMDPVGGDTFMDVLAAADVVLLHERPGLQEMCAPSKLTSYFAAGRPVLAATETNSAAAAEIRKSGAGVVVEPGSGTGYWDALVELLAMDHDVIATSARAYAGEALSEGLAIERYHSWVSELLGQPRQTSSAVPPTVSVDR